MAETQNFQAGELTALTVRMFSAAGAPEHIAQNVAEILVGANLAGHDSHGALRIPAYLRQITKGDLNPAAEPTIVKETTNTLLLNGNKGFGHHTARVGMQMAVAKAKQNNVCAASFINTMHIGRLGEYGEQAARSGCVGIITYGTGGKNQGSVTPFGGAGRALSTNPMAVGIPTGDDHPFVLDIATSVVAEGKLQVARSKGLDVPPGYIVDKEGRPTTRTLDFYEGGFLLPFGGHKGYGLSLLITLLGGLSGNFNVEQATMGGELMQVINIEAFTPLEQYQQGVRAFLDGVKATPPSPGFQEVLVPGDFEARTRAQRLAEGIELPEMIVGQLQEWAAKLGVTL